MTVPLLLIAWPSLAALAALIASAIHRRLSLLIMALGHAGAVVLAGRALLIPSADHTVVWLGPISLMPSPSADSLTAVTLVPAAVLLALLGWYSTSYVGAARHATFFLSLLLFLETGINLVLLAGDLLALYVGFLLLSLGLMLLIGLDFGSKGQEAALRLFVTLEVPSLIMLVIARLLGSRIGTAALTDLEGRSTWMAVPSGTVLIATLGIVLLTRTGLVPLHAWVVAGCRAAVAPAALAITGIALPLGALVTGRVSDLIVPSGWVGSALAVLAALTVVLAGIGALREETAFGWLAYLSIGETALIVFGLLTAAPADRVAAWIGAGTTAAALVAVGMHVGLATRAVGHQQLDRLGWLGSGLGSEWTGSLAVLALLPLPPFAPFADRLALLARLLRANSIVEHGAALLMILGTGLLAAALLRPAGRPNRLTRSEQVRRNQPTRSVPLYQGTRGAPAVLGLLLSLLALVGSTQMTWAMAIGRSLLFFLSTGLVLGTVGLAGVLSSRGGWSFGKLGERWAWGAACRTIGRMLDPYILIGGILLIGGRASALTLEQTLGRLARAR
ncbi:MAG: hypothetical protein IRY83_07675 [Chloroflexi bacterium]|nr:hypothetical protein [Chloroflexota bacterium]